MLLRSKPQTPILQIAITLLEVMAMAQKIPVTVAFPPLYIVHEYKEGMAYKLSFTQYHFIIQFKSFNNTISSNFLSHIYPPPP